MPKSLDALVRWYVEALALELPERLHVAGVWRDRVSAHELEGGTKPVGGSHLGSPALAGGFRALIEGSESMVDEDGWYVWPVRAALSRLRRRQPFMARDLFALGMLEGDIARLLDQRPGWEREQLEVYLAASLRALWTVTYDRTVRSG